MIFDLPEIPISKQYLVKMTPEQLATQKCVNKEELSEDEQRTLKESIAFYEQVFPLLKEIDLSKISDTQVSELKSYLDKVFNTKFLIFNDLHFDILFRVSFVREEFLEKGKVRNPDFLKYPPLEIVKRQGIYNRANSNEYTVFYASFYENVALRETKPSVGDRIIISTWKNISGKPFNSYPITNSNVPNEGVSKSTKAFNKTKKYNHPLFAEIMDLVFEFLASEFVKEVNITHPKRYEYLFSSYFADKTLLPFNEDDTTPNYDLIIYPSVAWKHLHDNVAIVPESVDSKLKLINTIEYEVEETFYEKQLELDEMPANLKFIREATWIEDDLIIWEDE